MSEKSQVETRWKEQVDHNRLRTNDVISSPKNRLKVGDVGQRYNKYQTQLFHSRLKFSTKEVLKFSFTAKIKTT